MYEKDDRFPDEQYMIVGEYVRDVSTSRGMQLNVRLLETVTEVRWPVLEQWQFCNPTSLVVLGRVFRQGSTSRTQMFHTAQIRSYIGTQ